MAKLRVLLDAGHGQGENRGFINGNEGDANYYMSLALKKELEKYDIHVGLTREKISDNPTLYQRGDAGTGYDLLLSLHTNAGASSTRGIEIFPDTNPPVNHYALAVKLALEISKLGTPNRGVRTWTNDGTYTTNVTKPPYKSNYFGVLRSSEAKFAMLVEFAYHTNQQDRDFIVNKREQIAATTAKVVADYYGLTEAKRELTTLEFIDRIKDAAIDGWLTDGILPSITLVQGIIESNKGNSELAVNANNLFGIKASPPWTGASYPKKTTEYIDGQRKEVIADFRKYSSWEDSIKDHSEFFTSTDWRKKLYANVIKQKDWKIAVKALQGTYATSPVYAQTLTKVINDYKLWEYDEIAFKKEQDTKTLPVVKPVPMNQIYDKEHLLKMKPRYGVFTYNQQLNPQLLKLVKGVSGAVIYDRSFTPEELFDKIIQVGGDKRLSTRYEWIDEKDIDKKIDEFIVKNQLSK